MSDKKIEVNYQVQDYLDAQFLHWIRSVLGFRFARVVFVVGVALGAFYAFLAYEGDAGPYYAAVAGLGGFALSIVALVALSLVNRFFFLGRSAKRAFAQMKEYNGLFSYTIEGQSFQITSPRGTAILPFSDFVKWNENEKTFLLYRTDRMFHFIPGHTSDEGFRRTLKAELAAANVPQARFRQS